MWVVGVLVSGWVTIVKGGDCWVSQWPSPLAWEYWWGRLFWRRHKSREVGI
jgi:hypothetical protein